MKTTNTLKKTAKFAGWAYFLIIITSVLSIAFGPYRLMVEDDITKTIENIASNQTLYRIGIVYEILMYMGVIMLSVALYQILQSINKAKALTALLCRFSEAIMGVLMLIGSIIILYFINSDFAVETIQNSVSVISEIKDALMSLLMIFIGAGSVIFFHLFYKSRYIPRWLSIFGITAFSFIIIESLVLQLYPMEAWIFPGALAIVFEIVVGLWLIIKGVNTDMLIIKS
jgi:hypothetical protein